MVDGDRGDHRHVGIDDIDRIETPAEADFEDQRVELLPGEQPQRAKRTEFEIGEQRAGARILDRGESIA